MFCSRCGDPNGKDVTFCRKCGADLAAVSNVKQLEAEPKNPDELTGSGIGNVIIGDGFFMVGVILAATNSAVSSLLWLFLLIPAFYFFGKGFAAILHARQMRRQSIHTAAIDEANIAALPPERASIIETFRRHPSGDLVAVPSVTERTTRDLG